MIKLKEISRFFRTLRLDYKSGKGPSKSYKIKGYLRLFILFIISAWNKLSAPFIYPIWYLFRKPITNKLYRNTTHGVTKRMLDDNLSEHVEKSLRKNGGDLLYWIWTYGDLTDPVVNKKSFIKRYLEGAFIRPRSTYCLMNFRTSYITEIIIIIDERNFNYLHKLEGGENPDGVYFKWILDVDGQWSFIYEDNNSENIFHFGTKCLLRGDVGYHGLFEMCYKKTDSSYYL
jgi:hypothetical protein